MPVAAEYARGVYLDGWVLSGEEVMDNMLILLAIIVYVAVAVIHYALVFGYFQGKSSLIADEMKKDDQKSAIIFGIFWAVNWWGWFKILQGHHGLKWR